MNISAYRLILANSKQASSPMASICGRGNLNRYMSDDRPSGDRVIRYTEQLAGWIAMLAIPGVTSAYRWFILGFRTDRLVGVDQRV